MSGPLHLHLGIHKTASTFLQRRFFPALGGVQYVSARGPLRPWLHAILRDDDLDFDPRASRRALDAAFDAALGHAAPRVVSDEQLYGSPYDGGATRTRAGPTRGARRSPARLSCWMTTPRAPLLVAPPS